MTSLEIETLESLREQFPNATIEELVRILPTIMVISSLQKSGYEWEVTESNGCIAVFQQLPKEEAPYTSADF